MAKSTFVSEATSDLLYVGQFRMRRDYDIWLNRTPGDGPQVGNLKSGTKGAFIDNQPEDFLNPADVFLMRDMDQDGILDSRDAEASLEEIERLMDKKNVLPGSVLADLGYVALTQRGDTSDFFVNQPRDGSLSWKRMTYGRTEKLEQIVRGEKDRLLAGISIADMNGNF